MNVNALPAGSVPPIAALSPGAHPIKLVSVVPDGGERFYFHCEYPDGFLREHQAADAQELAPKIVNFLRGRYGATSVKITSLPPLEAGAVITVEV